jgi:hypothetical protein
MANQEEIAKELAKRIRADTRHFEGKLPERYSLAWGGYIAGLYEWGTIDLSYYRGLNNLLPGVSEPDPVAEIFTGRDDDDDE